MPLAAPELLLQVSDDIVVFRSLQASPFRINRCRKRPKRLSKGVAPGMWAFTSHVALTFEGKIERRLVQVSYGCSV